jgi:hypothetical protein
MVALSSVNLVTISGGTYSEVGFFEATVDSTNPNNITGTFFDAGDTTNVGGRGSFTLLMANDGNSYSGSWSFDGENQLYPWDDIRISSNQASVDQCQTPTTANNDFVGRWTFELAPFNFITLDLCFNDQNSRYTYSYESTDNSALGYGLGWVELGGNALRGQWFTSTSEGIEYWIQILDGNTAINSFWPFTDLQTVQYFPCQGNVDNNWFNLHSIANFTRDSVSVVDSISCNRNAFLNVPHPIPSAVPSGVSPTPKASKSALPEHTSFRYNNASPLSASLMIVASIIAVLVLLF